MIELTIDGQNKIREYIDELWAERREILDARKDTAYNTIIPDMEDIIEDIEEEIDSSGDYYNNWNVTDNCISDSPLWLCVEQDFIIV